ncbi:SSV1 integrase-like protein [Pyrococcus sp. NA2]|nr:SSV1 integrase-like protein [Pyrococcus sp. NA2]
MVGPRGFEPRTSTLSEKLNDLWSFYKIQFSEWLSGQITEVVRKDYIKALDKFFDRHEIVTYQDLERALKFENYTDRLVKGLRKFVTFLEEEHILDFRRADDLRRIIKLRRETRIRDVFISDEELRIAYEKVKQKELVKVVLFELLVFSGIRLSHAVQLLNSFDESKLFRINDKIARYPLFAISRGKKRGFWAYAPVELFEKIMSIGRQNINYKTAQDWVTYGKVSANTIRKWHYTFMIRQGVPAEIADFIQGRASRTVGPTHYLNKTILADEWYSVIVDELKKVLEG